MAKKTNQSTVNSIAQVLGLSAGTVSIVLNGRGDEMRISEATQKRVMEYAKEINYQPNIYAKRLRKTGQRRNLPIIAVFWPANFSSAMVTRFFHGVMNFKDTDGREAEIMLQPYLPTELEKSAEFLSSEYYSGAVLMGLTDKDVSFVVHSSFDIPIVLLNRASDRCSSVGVDDFEIGASVARLFIQRGHKKLGLITYGSASSRAATLRRSGFLSTAYENSIYTDINHIVESEGMSFEEGKKAAEELIRRNEGNLPTAVFIQDSSLAIGALPVFKKHGIEIPRDMEIVSFGDNPQDAYTIPSLTSVRMPLEEMSGECLRIIFDALRGNNKKHTTSINPVSMVFRESCGDANGSFFK